jgi:diguanylate cyclase (GGDEF)-like protein/PAS domain S-box-containing protein
MSHRDNPDKFATLRQLAEEHLTTTPQTLAGLSVDAYLGQLENMLASHPDISKLLHELRVHQIELEMQHNELQQAQHRLRQERARYAELYHNAPVGYLTTTPDGTIIEVNPTGARLLGSDVVALRGQSLTHWIVPDDKDIYYFHLRRLAEGSAPQRCELRIRQPRASPITTRLESTGITDAAGERHCRTVLLDVSERVRAEQALQQTNAELEQRVEARTAELQASVCEHERTTAALRDAYQELEHIALTDPLTGLANRRRLYEVGQMAMQDMPKRTILLYLDLDRFKAFNDSLGHDAGDELLLQVARRLQQSIGDEGLFARIGGDEFAVLLRDADIKHAVAQAQQLIDQLHQPFDLHGQRVHLGGSIGIAASDASVISFSMLLTRADIAMYQAKRSQTNIQVYHPSHDAVTPEHVQMEVDFRQALAAGTLTLHYQPICSSITSQQFAAEALVRWPHPTKGMLTPGAFLSLAEEIGLLHALDRWVLRAVCTQIACWQVAGVKQTVSVNLSAASLQQADLIDTIAALLHQTGIPADRLIIELTEHTALRDLSLSRQVLSDLQTLGIRIALDDFGTGYASLTYLRELPVNILKIDRSFVAGIGRNPKDEALLHAVLALGARMDILIIAEGVESESQRIWLREMGRCHLQGFLIGRPGAASTLMHPDNSCT